MKKLLINKKLITVIILVIIVLSLIGRFSFVSNLYNNLMTNLEYHSERISIEVRRILHQSDYEYLTQNEIQQLISKKGGFDKETIREYEMKTEDSTIESIIKTVELYTNKSGKLLYSELESIDEDGNKRLMVKYNYVDAGYEYYDLYINGIFSERKEIITSEEK